MIDWELAFIGDPMNDLARMRTRDMWYPTGNLPKWLQYYSEYSGTPMDLDKLRYYSVIAMLTTALALGPVFRRWTRATRTRNGFPRTCGPSAPLSNAWPKRLASSSSPPCVQAGHVFPAPGELMKFKQNIWRSWKRSRTGRRCDRSR